MSVVLFFFSMILLPPISICTVTLFPYTTLFLSAQLLGQPDVAVGAGDGDRVGDIVDDIMLLDIVRLALPEDAADKAHPRFSRSEEHTSELQSLMRNSYAVFCLQKKKKNNTTTLQRYKQ